MSNAIFGKGEPNETTLNSGSGIDVPPDAMFIARYDINGRLIWAKQSNDSSNVSSNSVSVSSDGSIFVTGYFGGGIFGKGEANETILVSEGGIDIFLARYNMDGLLEWAKSAGGPDTPLVYDRGYSISANNDGTVVITGSFASEATFGKNEINETTLSASDSATFIASYNADGSLAWAKKISTVTDYTMVSGPKVSTTLDGNIYVTGSFQNSAIFGPGEANQCSLTSEGIEDLFFAKYDTDGSFEWVIHYGGKDWDNGIDVHTSTDGSVFLLGWIGSDTIFGEGEENETCLNPGLFIAKYNSNGAIEWVKRAIDNGAIDFDISPKGDAVLTGMIDFIFGQTWGPGDPNQTNLYFNPSCNCGITTCADITVGMFSP